MSWSRWLSCLMASGWLLTQACSRPSDFQILTESTRLARERPAPRDSAIFDGKVIRLRGARGETLGVQLRASDGKARSVRLSVPQSVGHVAGFSVRSLEVREPSTDMYGPSSGPGTYPDILVPASGSIQTHDLAYFDVAIRADATPGTYKGHLHVDDRAIPAVIDVTHARIDLARRPLVWVFYAPRELARAHGVADGDGPALIAKEAEYAALFRAHGAFLASDLPPSRFGPRRRFVHDVSYWPVAVDVTTDETIQRDVERWLALFRGSGVTPFAIPIDEPHSEKQRARVRHIGAAVKRSGGGPPGLLRAVTDEALPSYGDTVDVFISPKSIPDARNTWKGGGKHFWTYNGKPPEAGSMILDTDGGALRSWGWIAARYDIELWYAWEGMYFSDRYNGGGPTDVMHEPITFDERLRGGTDWGNGDGVLAYPGPLPSLRLKALRRGLQDRLLLQELEHCGDGETARKLERETVPRALGEATSGRPTWPATERAWEDARMAVLDAIDTECHDDS